MPWPARPIRVATEDTMEDIIKEHRGTSCRTSRYATDEDGIMVKADTIGSLEAITNELREANINIAMAEVGDISKKDLVNAQTLNDPLKRVILGFNVNVLGDAKEYSLTTPTSRSLIIISFTSSSRTTRSGRRSRKSWLKRSGSSRSSGPGRSSISRTVRSGRAIPRHRRAGHGRMHQARRRRCSSPTTPK